jgi:methionine aminotransferase
MKDSRFKALKTSGTYFQLMEYAEISDLSDVDFCRWLTVEHKVAAIPVSVFYANREDHKVIRFCFAKKVDTLREAAERLCKI